MKRILVLIIGVSLFACQESNKREEIQNQIKEYRSRVSELNSKIDELRGTLDELSGGEDMFKIPVKIKNIKPEEFNNFFEVNANVSAEQNAFISPEQGGQIKDIRVDEGDRVQKGELLVKLNLEVSQSSIEQVKTNLELARKLYQKQKDLWDKNIGSEIEYLEAKNRKERLEKQLAQLKAQQDMSIIKAPFSGVVEKIYQKEGEMASPGRQVLQLVNLKAMQAEANISERYISDVHKGDSVQIRFPAYENLRFKVPIIRKGNVINEESRTFPVEVKLNNQNKKIKPNLRSVMRVNDYSKDSSVVVPSIIVKEDRQGTYLYKAVKKDGNSVARKAYVETGRSFNDITRIDDGISFGDKVIISGFEQVSNGSNINIK